MKSVRENDVAHQIVLRTITNVERGIELKIPRDVAGEADRGRVFRAANPIHLYAPGLIEIIGIAEDDFIFVAGMKKPDDGFLMLGVVARLDKWLGIHIQVRRPVYEPNGQKQRLFR